MRPRWIVALAAVAALLAGLLAVGLLDRGGAHALAPGPRTADVTLGARAHPAPAFQARDLRGQPVSLRALAGRPVVINFFASWCQPCKREAPGLARLSRTYAGRVAVVGIALTSSRQGIRSFTRRYGWTWPIVDDNRLRIAHRFGVVGQPTTFVIARDGRIATELQGETAQRTLAGVLERLLAT
jgi:cytochrome c biogenesis protein CcmG, thiol:disulfide interchange protein DsbE